MARRRNRLIVSILFLAACLGGCSFFRSMTESMKNVEKTTKEIEKKVSEKDSSAEEAQEQPLLDNKVSAMRVQAALKKEGAEFDQVTVEGTKEAVVLTGTVKSSKDRERAVEIAKGVQRKMVLKNEVQVHPKE